MKENGMFQNSNDAVKNAICSYVALNLDDRLTDEQFFKFINFVDYRTFKRIPDTDFVRHPRLKKFINFSKLDRKQVIRLMTRDISIFERIDLNYFMFSVSELEYFLSNHPNHVKYFNFDLNAVSGKEIIILLKADLNFIYDIDFKDKKFARLDFQDMIKYFSDIEQVMEKLNFEELDNFLTRVLIVHTKDKYIDKLNLKKLNYLDWLEILSENPKLLKYCDLSLFTTGDYFKLAQLVCAVDEVEYLIEENRDKISPLAWEKLLLHDTEKYSKLCNFSTFKEINWKNILRKKPYLRKYKVD